MKNIAEIRIIATQILKKYGIAKAGLFGSVARNEANANSDIDILIEPVAGMSLFDFIRLKNELEESLHAQVDLVDYSMIKKRLRTLILGEESRLYG